MGEYKLSENAPVEILTTFRYEVNIYGKAGFFDKEYLLNIGDFVSRTSEDSDGIIVEVYLPTNGNVLNDLTSVLNKNLKITRIEVLSRDEHNNLILVSNYKVTSLYHWKTFKSADEHGEYLIELSATQTSKQLDELEQVYKSLVEKGYEDEDIQKAIKILSSTNKDVRRIQGKITSKDKNVGNQVATLTMFFKASKSCHEFYAAK